MQTLNQMSDAELLAWAIEFRKLAFTTTLGKRMTDVTPVPITDTAGEFPPIAVAKLFTYGGGRKFNDEVASESTLEGKVAGARALIARYKNGQVGRIAAEAPDPFMTIVLRIVRARVKAKNPARYKEIMDGEKPDQVFTAILEKARETQPDVYQAIMDAATEERKSQERKAKMLEKVDLDTGDL